jgi:type I restriction enzyme S subunit
MPRANWSDVGGFRVALPPSNIRSAFGCALQPMLELVTRSIHESITLAELRDTLLPELLSGRLSVKSPTDAT